MRNVVEHVEPRDPLVGEQLRGIAFRLLQDRGENVADRCFASLRALDMKDGRLEHATKRRRLLGILIRFAPLPLYRLVEIRAQRAAQPRQINATRFENPFAVGVVRDGVQQVFERQVRVPPRHGLSKRDVENNFKCR